MAGLNLDRPPVQIWRSVTRALETTLLTGVGQVADGAGGFARPEAIPNLARAKSPANPNARASQEVVAKVGPQGLRTRARIDNQFGL